MKKKNNPTAVLLFLTGLICIAFLFFFGRTTYRHIQQTDGELTAAMEQISASKMRLDKAERKYSSVTEEKQATVKYMSQKAQTMRQELEKTRERAEQLSAEDAGGELQPSVFSQIKEPGSSGSSVFSTPAGNGHIVGIDPGHQGWNVDMSATEPNGPGSSEMKAQATSGTQGTYSGLPEYQLNLDVSLKLRTELENRGYQVVMTRTDNDTAISNRERAQLAASEGSEIYVRIHANGDDSHTASGAMTMCPSPQNPYVSYLYEDSNRLSQCIIDSYCQATGFSSLGVHYYDNMTGINWSTIPVTILEMGFMTYEAEDLQMADEAFQDTMVQGIADGIDAYFAS